jgi:hypothetical protein
LPTNIRMGWKSLPRTNTRQLVNYGQKSFITLGPVVETLRRRRQRRRRYRRFVATTGRRHRNGRRVVDVVIDVFVHREVVGVVGVTVDTGPRALS